MNIPFIQQKNNIKVESKDSNILCEIHNITPREEKELLQAIEEAKCELEMAYQNFEYATDKDLVDSYIYELQSLQKKYEYLIKQFKKIN